jgi:hypothetical protein
MAWWDNPAPPFDLFLKSQQIDTARRTQTRGSPMQDKSRTERAEPRPSGEIAGRSPNPTADHIFHHGDRVRFIHSQVEGIGKLVASTMNSVTIRTDDGREHTMRHDALRPYTEPSI